MLMVDHVPLPDQQRVQALIPIALVVPGELAQPASKPPPRRDWKGSVAALGGARLTDHH